jgi:UDP-N-acetylmuramoyl-L-alanyl-D-glutamate--2,6-diaminopimelate ligase
LLNENERPDEALRGSASWQERTTRPLAELLAALPEADPSLEVPGIEIHGIADHTDEVRPGTLFVAHHGTHLDGHLFARDAVQRGAVAILVERPLESDPGVPVVRVASTRRALALLAAEWFGRPADRLRLIGITGTVGKTSVLKMLEVILEASGMSIGTIGTLGVSVAGESEETGYTAPNPLLLHAALARIVEAGCDVAAMEVTSHALDQERVHGLSFDLGVFTTLIPFEHADYHATFGSYVEVKRRFLDHLRPGAPIAYSHDNAIVRRLVRHRGLRPIGCGKSTGSAVRIEDERIETDGTSLRLNVREPVARVDGGTVGPLDLSLRLRTLGRPNVINAALAATAALSFGADPASIPEALAGLAPLPRRMSIVHTDGALILDDAANHPDSVSALFEVVEQLPVRRAHALFAIRGRRGTKINRRTAEALAIWADRRPLDTLILTRSEDAVDELNRVQEEESDAFRSVLQKAGIPFEEIATLDDAVPAILERAREGDIVLLLGTQGMDGGFDRAKRWLDRNPHWPAPGR